MTATRQRNPRGQGELLRTPLIDAAIAVIDETGDVSKVSVRAITRRAGVSPTALYLHFPDRDALVDAAIDAGFAAFNAVIIEAFASTADPRGRLRAMGTAYLAFAERQPALYSVIFGARRPRNRLVPRAAGATDRGEALDGLLDAVTAAGAADARGVAIGLWSGLHGFATLRASEGPVVFGEPEAFVRALMDAYLA